MIILSVASREAALKKKHAAGAIIAVCVASSLFAYLEMQRIQSQSLRIDWLTRELRITNSGWNVTLARAEFNLTAHLSDWDEIRIEQVKVNGTVADFFPQALCIKNHESVIVMVYFSYQINTKYRFDFLDDEACRFSVVATSPYT